MKKIWSPLFELPFVYRAWQAPFVESKLRLVLRNNDLSSASRVLDVGCGPGTNAPHFRNTDYLGLDINPSYVDSARRRHGMRFEVADVTRYRVTDGTFDFILVNSFFHHVADDDCDRILAHLATLLTEGGRINVIDLVLPPRASPSRLLALMDRGDYARPLEAWHTLFTRHFREEVFQQFDVGKLVPGVALWKMVYFKGCAA